MNNFEVMSEKLACIREAYLKGKHNNWKLKFTFFSTLLTEFRFNMEQTTLLKSYVTRIKQCAHAAYNFPR